MPNSIVRRGSRRPDGMDEHRKRHVHVWKRIWLDLAELFDHLPFPVNLDFFLYIQNHVNFRLLGLQPSFRLQPVEQTYSRIFSWFSVSTHSYSCFSSLFRKRDGRTCAERELGDSKMSHSELRVRFRHHRRVDWRWNERRVSSWRGGNIG